MTERFYSVEQVAERLGLHVRTIRNYVRDGRLNAVRIGKQYRISHADLEDFTRSTATAAPDPAPRQRHTEVSSIVEIEAVDADTAHRLTTALTSSATHDRQGGRPLRVQTVYDPDRSRMKVIVLGGTADTARLLDYIEGILAP